MRFLSVLFYMLVYQYVHTEYLYRHFHYLGYKSFPIEIPNLILGCFFLFIPYCYNKKFRESQFELFFAIIYLLLFIPIVITYLNHYPIFQEFITNTSPIILGFIIILSLIKTRKTGSGLDKIIPYSNKVENVYSKNFQNGLFFINLFLTIFLIIAFRSSLSFVSFDNVYEHRSKLNISNPIIGYIILWNTYLISPLSLSTGLLNKNKKLIFIGIFGSIIVYGINASKIVLFIPLLIIGFYFLKSKTTDFLKSISLVFSMSMLFILAISSKFFMLSAVILMRTFGISGLLTYQYNEFFKVNSYTYFSHVNFVNFFTEMYPYGNLSLGMVVSRYFDENSIANSNANFLATDGYSSFGGLGIIVISFVFVYFLNFWGKSAMNNATLMKFMLIPFSFIVLNVGLFTSILSGGFLFLIVYNNLSRVK